MRLNENFQGPFQAQFYDVLRPLTKKVNGLAKGTLADTDGKAAAIPTSGTYAKGDFLRNSNPSELGSAASKYVIFGWICLVSGTPGTWVECRFPTGN